MKRRLILLLCIVFCLCLAAPAALALENVPLLTSNMGDHNYINAARWTDPSNSALIHNDDGTFTRVENVGTGVTVEIYSADYTYVSGQLIEAELPIYGGFHNGKDYNFLIFGQENPNESDEVEVIRVVRYTKDWQRVDAASLYGANTTVPFDAGGMSTAEYNGYLYLRTSHEMYTSDDGLNHQANLTLNIRISDMTITDSFYDVMNTDYGYVSHSFNQFIRVDASNGTLVAVDHGDANPRSVVLCRYYGPAGQDQFMVPQRVDLGGGYYTWKYVEHVDLLPIYGASGANDTGVSVGGFEISSTSYLTAGNTLPQTANDDPDGARNIFLAVTDKDTLATEIKYLTSYSNLQYLDVSNPQLTKINDNKFMLSWTVINQHGCQFYVFVDGDGNQLTDVFSIDTPYADTIFSDCQPIMANGLVTWYVTAGCKPTFWAINPETGAYTESHMWNYYLTAAPTDTADGSVECTCYFCGTQVDHAIPQLTEENYPELEIVEPTCEEAGVARYLWCSPYGDWLNYEITSAALGHAYGDLQLPEGAVCGGYVDYYKTCSRCGKVVTENHYYDHNYETITTEPTCTEWGQGILICTRCGDEHHRFDYEPPLGHDWSAWTVCGQPCQGTGWMERICANCNLKEVDDDLGQQSCSYVAAGEDHICDDVCKWCGGTRGHRYTAFGSALPDLYECYNCRSYFLLQNGQYVPHTHTWGPWTVLTPPTYNTSGAQEHTCTVCGMGELVSIPATGTTPEPDPDPDPDDGNPFTDVASGQYYYDPVLWAVEEGITTGTSATTFGPDKPCTRAQVVTFLWRAAGSPAPTTSDNPFTDVAAGQYYYDAVLWAVEEGITTGTSSTTFSPDKPCTRAQVVTFLWRFADCPAPTTANNPFGDVGSGAYYYNAVLWAVEKGVTTGTSATTFGPDKTCTRAQIVTFLYRAVAE